MLTLNNIDRTRPAFLEKTISPGGGGGGGVLEISSDGDDHFYIEPKVKTQKNP